MPARSVRPFRNQGHHRPTHVRAPVRSALKGAGWHIWLVELYLHASACNIWCWHPAAASMPPTRALLRPAVGSQPKVAQLEAPGAVQQAVCGLDVAVHHRWAARVQVGQRAGQVRRQCHRPDRTRAWQASQAKRMTGGVFAATTASSCCWVPGRAERRRAAPAAGAAAQAAASSPPAVHFGGGAAVQHVVQRVRQVLRHHAELRRPHAGAQELHHVGVAQLLHEQHLVPARMHATSQQA